MLRKTLAVSSKLRNESASYFSVFLMPRLDCTAHSRKKRIALCQLRLSAKPSAQQRLVQALDPAREATVQVMTSLSTRPRNLNENGGSSQLARRADSRRQEGSPSSQTHPIARWQRVTLRYYYLLRLFDSFGSCFIFRANFGYCLRWER